MNMLVQHMLLNMSISIIEGLGNLQRQIIDIMDEHPEFDIVDITKK